jgi:hypothetical protein
MTGDCPDAWLFRRFGVLAFAIGLTFLRGAMGSRPSSRDLKSTHSVF